MAKIELEIGGKYTAQQAFDRLDTQLKGASRNAGRVLTQVSSGFGSVLTQIEGLGPGIQSATTALNGLASAGLQGGAFALVAIAVQKCIEKFNELKNSSMDMGVQTANIVTHAAGNIVRQADKAILAGKSALLDAAFAAKSANADLQYALSESGRTYQEKMENALKVKIDQEAKAVGDAAKAVVDAQYKVAEAYAKQEKAQATRTAREDAVQKKTLEAQAALSLAVEEQRKLQNRGAVKQQEIVALDNEIASIKARRVQMETEGLSDTMEFISLGYQIEALDIRLKTAKEEELTLRKDQNEKDLEAKEKVRQAELAYANAVRDMETLKKNNADDAEKLQANVLLAEADLAEATKKETEAHLESEARKREQLEKEKQNQEVADNIAKLEVVRAGLIAEGNQCEYEATNVLKQYTSHLESGLFTQEELDRAKKSASEQIKVNGEAYALATELMDGCMDSQGELREALDGYREALKKGTLTVEEVRKSMETLKDIKAGQDLQSKIKGMFDFGGINLTIPTPLDTRDQQALQKADDMINFGRIARDNERQARNILTSIKNQGPTLRKFLHNELPPAQQKLAAQYFTQKYKELENALGPEKAKEKMKDLLTEAGQRDLLSSAKQKKAVENGITLFEGLKANAQGMTKREKDNANHLANIDKNTTAKMQ